MPLVITRKPGERFVIGKDIVVTITEIDRGKAKIAISAPREMVILREELMPPEDQAKLPPPQ